MESLNFFIFKEGSLKFLIFKEGTHPILISRRNSEDLDTLISDVEAKTSHLLELGGIEAVVRNGEPDIDCRPAAQT